MTHDVSTPVVSPPLVYSLHDGDAGMADLLGGKGANLGEMTQLGLGACGEHAGDPRTIHYFAKVGLDYVSCSPPRVPVARLEAGRAALSSDVT